MVNWLLSEGDIRHSRFVTRHATEDSPGTADEDTSCGRGNFVSDCFRVAGSTVLAGADGTTSQAVE